jgi:hypothetical protein
VGVEQCGGHELMTGGITGWVEFGGEGVEMGAAGMLESVIVRGRWVMG